MAFCVVDFSKGKIVGTSEQYNQIAELNQARRGTKIKIKKCSISNKGQSRKAALQIKMTFSKTNMTFYKIIKENEIVFHPQGFLSAPKSGVAHLGTCLKFLAIFLVFSHRILHFMLLPLEILQEKFNAFN